MSVLLVNGDALRIPLADKSVHCVITSPPYWGLRDYKVGGQLGMEPTHLEYVDNIVQMARELWRVLRDDGTLWLNLGDSYAGSGGAGDWSKRKAGKQEYAGPRGNNVNRIVRGQRDAKRWGGGNNPASGELKAKDLVGIPWRCALALQADGWYLRSDVIWDKPNPMPESVTDRPTKSHEYIFLLSKSEHYYYDNEAIKEPAQLWTGQAGTFERESGKATELVAPGQTHASHRANRTHKEWTFGQDKRKQRVEATGGAISGGTGEMVSHGSTRNKRTVWEVATAPYSGAHFATYPPALIEPCVKAGTSERGCCPECGAPWERVVDRESNWQERKAAGGMAGNVGVSNNYQNGVHGAGMSHDLGSGRVVDRGWQPTCKCDAGNPVPATILDPFSGSGTTAMVARALGRNAVGLDLSMTYIRECARPRLQLDALEAWSNGVPARGGSLADLPMFADGGND